MSVIRIASGMIAVAALPLVHSPASGQVERVGFRLGIDRATQAGGFADLVEARGGTTESRTGFVAGAFLEYRNPALPEHVSVQAGLGIAQKGMRIPPEGGLRQRALDITYLEVPVLAKAAFPAGEVLPYAMGGPVLSFKLGTSGEVDGRSIDTGDEVKGTEFGLAFAVGARRGPVGLELRYGLGLSNISSSPDPDEAAKNRHWEIAATYSFPINRAR